MGKIALSALYKRSNLPLLVGLVVLLAELAWLVWAIQSGLSQPTLRSRATHLLVQHALAPEENRPALVEAAEQERVYIWPMSGLLFHPNQGGLPQKMDGLLAEHYGEEYTSLPDAERHHLLTQTLPRVEATALALARQVDSQRRLSLKQLAKLAPEELSIIGAQYIHTARYSWSGYDKDLFFLALPGPEEGIHLELAGVADAVEKSNFLLAILPPGILFILTLGILLFASLERLMDSRKIVTMTEVFKKFVPHQFLEYIAKKGIENIKLGEAESDYVTILFCDIRSFTSLAESMQHQEVLNFLNSYIQFMSKPIMENQGFVDKFIGDGIMAVFNHPDHDDESAARQAVQAAIDMQNTLRQYNGYRNKMGYLPIATGIGIHSGSVVFGTVGYATRMESTILGDSVNVASRLEGLTKHYRCPIIISNDTYQLLGDHDFLCRSIDTVTVVGRQTPCEIHEVFHTDPMPLQEKKRSTLNLFKESVDFYQQGQWQVALSGFEQCLTACSDDFVAELYRQRCRQALESNGSPESWDGVTRLKNK